MILATRLARKRSASTRMRAHSRGLMLTRRSKRHASGLQTAFEEKTDFSLLTDLTRAVPHRADEGHARVPRVPPSVLALDVHRVLAGMEGRMSQGEHLPIV